MSPLILLSNCPFKYLLGFPLKYNICLQLRSEIGQEGRGILALCEMTIPLAPSKACLAAFTNYTRYFMIPLNSKLLSCFPAIWTGIQQRSQGNPGFRAEPHLERSRDQQLCLGICFWALISFPTCLQPYEQRGKKVSTGTLDSPADRQNLVHIAVPDWRSHVTPRQPPHLPPAASMVRSENVNKHPNERKLLGCN